MFRLLNVDGRAALDVDGGIHDVATLSGDAEMADPMVAVSRHRELHELTQRAHRSPGEGMEISSSLGPPVPRPRQIFGIGLNYFDHATETGATIPPAPLTFTKFVSCLSGPTSDIPLSGDTCDWEVELVVVIGDELATPVARDNAWDHVAGVTLGQDISDRVVQRTGTPPQFCLGKSFRGFGPTGPALVSVDSLSDRNDIELSCEVSGEVMQSARTSQLIFDVPTLVSYLSSICSLFPGDLIFTGTPSGVGAVRGRYLLDGDVVVSRAREIGEMRNVCVQGTAPMAL